MEKAQIYTIMIPKYQDLFVVGKKIEIVYQLIFMIFKKVHQMYPVLMPENLLFLPSLYQNHASISTYIL